MKHFNTNERLAEFYSRGEELGNVWTHVVGLVLAIAGVGWLLWRGFRPNLSPSLNNLQQISILIYSASLILLFSMSVGYHAVSDLTLKRRFRTLDHVAVFIFIAASYTPFLLVKLSDSRRFWFMVIVWTIACLGVTFKIGFTGYFDRVTVVVYVAMGWLAVWMVPSLLAVLPRAAIGWLAAGGIMFTVGIVFFFWERIPFNHAIWHLFVLAGCVCHYVSIVNYVL